MGAGAGAHGGTVDAAALAGEHFDEMEGAVLGVLFARKTVEVLETGDGEIAVDGTVGVAEGVVHAALEGVGAAFFGGAEVEGALGGGVGRDFAAAEEFFQVREGAGEGKDVGMAVRLVFLGGAGAEEDDADIAEPGAQFFAVRLDGGIDGNDAVCEPRVVFADVIDGGGACAGEPEAFRVFAQEGGGGGAHQLGAAGGFADAREAEALEGLDEHAGRPVREIGEPAGGDGCVDGLVPFEHLEEPGDVAADLLGVRRADPDAFAAGDAGVLDDGGVTVFDADGFGVAVPDALVAVLTLIEGGEDRGLCSHSSGDTEGMRGAEPAKPAEEKHTEERRKKRRLSRARKEKNEPHGLCLHYVPTKVLNKDFLDGGMAAGAKRAQ